MQPALITPGRPQSQREKGLASSLHATQDPLDLLISELLTITKGLTQLAQAIGGSIDNASQPERERDNKLFKDIPTYLTALIHRRGTTNKIAEQPRGWAAVASKPPSQPYRDHETDPATPGRPPGPSEGTRGTPKFAAKPLALPWSR